VALFRLCRCPERLRRGGAKRGDAIRKCLSSTSDLPGYLVGNSQGRYDKRRKYTIMVVVFNIFGNDASMVLEAEMRSRRKR
jgi:hypothetical protein